MEQKILDNIMVNINEIIEGAIELAYMTGLKENEQGEWMPNVKRMVFYPDGRVYFMTMMESDEFLPSHEKENVISLKENGTDIVFSDDHVVEQDGKSYVYGPMIVRTDMDPEKEVELTGKQIRELLDKIDENREWIRFGYMTTMAFELK